MSDPYVRPQTPQAMLHRLPDKADSLATEPGATTKPSKYVVLIIASTAVAGKVQIAKSVADALGCPLFQGDSLHETSAKAANVSSSSNAKDATLGPNKDRYQRMWLSKMMRTGHLFPDESRPANEGSGFGGTPSSSSGSLSSASPASDLPVAATSAGRYMNKPALVANLRGKEEGREANLALMVTTHPVLEQWHKESVRHVCGEYGIGVIFVPLDEVDEPPILKPLDPRSMTSLDGTLGSPTQRARAAGRSLDDEIMLGVNVEATVEDLIGDIVGGVQEIMHSSR